MTDNKAAKIETTSTQPYRYITRIEFFWQPIVNRDFNTPIRLKLKFARMLVSFIAADALLVLSVWGVVWWLCLPVPWFPHRIVVVLAGAAVTIWAVKKMVNSWRTPIPIRQIKRYKLPL